MIGAVAQNSNRFVEQVQVNTRLRNNHVTQWEKRITDARGTDLNELTELELSDKGRYFPLDEVSPFEKALEDVQIKTNGNLMQSQLTKETVNQKSEAQSVVQQSTQKVDKIPPEQRQSKVNPNVIQTNGNQLNMLHSLYAFYGVNPYLTGYSHYGTGDLNSRLGMLLNGNLQTPYGMYTRNNPFYTVVPTLDQLY